MSIYKGDTLIAGAGTQIVTLYDKSSSDSSINWGYTSGIPNNTTISSKDFSGYKYLIISYYLEYFTGNVIANLNDLTTENIYFGRYALGFAGTSIYIGDYSINSYKTSITLGSYSSPYNNFNTKNNVSGACVTKIVGVL